MAKSHDVTNSGFWTDSERPQVVARIIAKTRVEPKNVFEAERYSDKLGRMVGHYIPGREALQSKLDATAKQYELDVHWKDKPSASELIKALGSIEKAASRILKRLNIDPSTSDVLLAIRPNDLRYALQGQAHAMGERIGGYPHHPPEDWTMSGATYKDWQGPAQLRDVLIGITQLRDWARKAAVRGQARSNPNRSKHYVGDIAIRRLLQELCGIWVECFDSMPGLSRHTATHKPTGPFLRFAAAAFEEMGVTISSEALATRIRRLMGKPGKIILIPPILTS